MEDLFKEKYIKYKNKYLELKNKEETDKPILRGGTFPFPSIDEHSLCTICKTRFLYKEVIIKGQNCMHVVHYICLMKFILTNTQKFFFRATNFLIDCPDIKDTTPWAFVTVNKHMNTKDKTVRNAYPYNLTDASVCKYCNKNFEYNEILLRGVGGDCKHVVHYMCVLNHLLTNYEKYFIPTLDKPVKCPDCNQPWQFIGIVNDTPGDVGDTAGRK